MGRFSTSTTWTMARRVDARRRWVELPTQVVLRLLFRRVWLRVSHGFSFVESCYILNDRPSSPRVKGMCTDVDEYGLYVQS